MPMTTPLSPAPTRVLVAHAETLVRLGIAATLGRDGRFDVSERAAETLDVGGIVGRHGTAPWQVLVADLATGIEAARTLRAARAARLETSPCAVLVVSSLPGELNIRAALEAGVLGYLTYESRGEQLVDAVGAVARGQRYLAGCIANRLAETVALELPTRREIDVLRLMSTGLCNKSIAAELNISAGTVKAHVKALLQKLDAPTRTAAADIAKRRGLLDPLGAELAVSIARPRPARHASREFTLIHAL